MSLIRLLESWAEGLVRIVIGMGFVWIGVVEGASHGVLLEIVGTIFVAAGVAEIWFLESAVRRLPLRPGMTPVHPALVQCELPVFYATTEGQTRRIAEKLATIFRGRGFGSRAIDLASSDVDYIDWSGVRGVVIGASLHVRRHQRVAETFVREHAVELNRRPSVFFSVSLAIGSDHAAQTEAARQIAVGFPATLGWRPDAVVCLAGRLAYTRYGVLTRFIVKRIARRQGAPTDTSRDYEFTNWDAVTSLAERLARVVSQRSVRSAA